MIVSFPTTPTQILFLANRIDDNGVHSFVDETTHVGLSSTDNFYGLSVADFQGCGFTDLYLTRESSGSFFYKAKIGDGQISNSWIGVRLKSPYGANNTDGLGASVTVTAGSWTQIRLVDGGGSGVASQHEPDLVFGLGSYAGNVSIEILWPSGRTQTLPNIPINNYITITDDSPVIDEPTIQFSKVYYPGSNLIDWVFTWETFNESPTSRDKVVLELDNVPGRCQPAHAVLTEQTPGVSVVDSLLSGLKYQHTLIYSDVACESKCTIPYTVESSVIDYSSTSTTQSLKVSTCLQSQ